MQRWVLFVQQDPIPSFSQEKKEGPLRFPFGCFFPDCESAGEKPRGQNSSINTLRNTWREPFLL